MTTEEFRCLLEGAVSRDMDSLEEVLQKIIIDGKIILEKARSPKVEECYRSINEFCDGKNITRIYQKLVEKEIL